MLLARLAGKISSTSINILAWVDSDIDVTCTLSDGQTQTITSASGTYYGTVEFIFSGLSGGTTYTATVSASGENSLTLYPKTAPPTGATFTVASGTCQSNGKMFRFGDVIRKYNPHVFFAPGDWPYTQLDWDRYSLTGWNALGADMTLDQLTEYHCTVMKDPHNQVLMHQTHWIHAMDDHEYPGSNFDNSLASLNSGVTGTAFTDVAAVVVQARAASYAFNQRAQHSAGTAEPTYPAIYHAFDMGDARIIVLDCETYKTSTKTLAYPTSTCLGTVQHAWLKSELASTDKTWKIIISNKQILSDLPSGDGIDSYNHASGEAEIILDYIDDSVNGGNPDSWVSPGGVLWLTGDRHYNAVHYDRVLQFTTSLGSGHSNGDLITGSLHHLWGYEASTNYDPQSGGGKYYEDAGGVAIVNVTASTKLEIIIDTLKGAWTTLELYPGENAPTIPNQKIAVI